MADLYGPCPPPGHKFEEPVWQVWLSGLAKALKKSTIGGGASSYVAPARVAGTAYVAGGNSRFVTIVLQQAAAGDGGNLLVGGTVIAQVKSPAAGAGLATLQAVVAKGQTYQLTLVGGATIASWSELGS